ncbi:probable serine/threonine-protein kinase DDB_G0282963 [Oppia nitens]|uniref:probable serine/threonine-protein kinase DDB_G0282963 n=1 Tax=Oppia nitens TaxID=1686743 RepID=UPI0023D99A14|nr:probable serine/threonine-protein kinase DDB_G0282963 [Oppia nitens]
MTSNNNTNNSSTTDDDMNTTSEEVNTSSLDLQLMDGSPDQVIPESDNDSGIVAIVGKNKRIGSTASNSDEDHSLKDKINQSVNQLLNTYGGVGSVVKPRVRFDDELPLSEQNMRKSCKKLFETLRNNQNSLPSNEESSYNNNNKSLLPSCHCRHFAPQSGSSVTANNSCNACYTNDLSEESFDDNELLITTYGRDQYPTNGYNRQSGAGGRHTKYHTLDNRKKHNNPNLWSSKAGGVKSGGKTFEDIVHRKSSPIDCNEALDKIKRMSDRLESSSMVNAFARPAFIKSADFGQTMDTLYETIFPTTDIPKVTTSQTPKTSATVESPNSHVNRWLNSSPINSGGNNNNIDRHTDDDYVIDVKEFNVLSAVAVGANNNRFASDPKPPCFLRSIPNDIHKIHSMNSPSKGSYISADQIYPDMTSNCGDDNINGLPVTDVMNRSFDERTATAADQRFSQSYSAGDDMKKGILRNRLKGATSEIDLNKTSLTTASPKSKSFLQRFKSAFSRAFTSSTSASNSSSSAADNKQFQKQLAINTVHNSKSQSQSDLRINCDPKGSRMNLNTGGGMDSQRHHHHHRGSAAADRSPSFVKNIRSRISLRRSSNKVNSPDKDSKSTNKAINSRRSLLMDQRYNNSSIPSSATTSTLLSSPKHLSLSLATVDNIVGNNDGDHNNRVWGELIKLNSDSSQVIQIRRQTGHPFGFFVARGTVNQVKGVFVSRMKDEETQKCLTGVLEIGDEILAIDGESVKEANIMRINQLIANKDTIRLTIIPYMNNKYF